MPDSLKKELTQSDLSKPRKRAKCCEIHIYFGEYQIFELDQDLDIFTELGEDVHRSPTLIHLDLVEYYIINTISYCYFIHFD